MKKFIFIGLCIVACKPPPSNVSSTAAEGNASLKGLECPVALINQNLNEILLHQTYDPKGECWIKNYGGLNGSKLEDFIHTLKNSSGGLRLSMGVPKQFVTNCIKTYAYEKDVLNGAFNYRELANKKNKSELDNKLLTAVNVATVADYYFIKKQLELQAAFTLESIAALDSALKPAGSLILSESLNIPTLAKNESWLSQLRGKCKTRPKLFDVVLKKTAETLAVYYPIVQERDKYQREVDDLRKRENESFTFPEHLIAKRNELEKMAKDLDFAAQAIVAIEAPWLAGQKPMPWSQGLSSWSMSSYLTTKNRPVFNSKEDAMQWIISKSSLNSDLTRDLRAQLNLNRENLLRKHKKIQEAAACIHSNKRTACSEVVTLLRDVPIYKTDFLRSTLAKDAISAGAGDAGFLSDRRNEIFVGDAMFGSQCRQDYRGIASDVQHASTEAAIIVGLMLAPYAAPALGEGAATIANFGLRMANSSRTVVSGAAMANAVLMGLRVTDAAYWWSVVWDQCAKTYNKSTEALDLEETDTAFCRDEGIGSPVSRVAGQSTIVRDFRMCLVSGAIQKAITLAPIIATFWKMKAK